MKRLDRAMGGWLRKTVFEPWPWVFFAVSVAIAFLGDDKGLRSVSTAVGSVQVGLGIAFLGTVLAGLSIVVAFMDEAFLTLLERYSPGIDAHLWPFEFTAGAAAASALTGMVLILVGSPSDMFVLRLALLFALWSFLYLLLVMLQLVRFVAELLRLRASQIRNSKL